MLHVANQYKKDEKFFNQAKNQEGFFKSKFFQNETELFRRIEFVDGNFYSINENDLEATELIEFIGMNDNRLSTERKQHVDNLKKCFEESRYGDIKNYLTNHRQFISFPTAPDNLKEEISKLIDIWTTEKPSKNKITLWLAKGKIRLKKNFDDPIDDFKYYH